MKRIVSIVLELLFTFSLAGCAKPSLPAVEMESDGPYVMLAIQADLNHDGIYEEYQSLSVGSGIISYAVSGYDSKNGKTYELGDRGVTDYFLTIYKETMYIVSVPSPFGSERTNPVTVYLPGLDTELSAFSLKKIKANLQEKVLQSLSPSIAPSVRL